MCGRYAFSVKKTGRWRAILVGEIESFADNYNFPPTSKIPVYTP